jgi:hypothetical protein
MEAFLDEVWKHSWMRYGGIPGRGMEDFLDELPYSEYSSDTVSLTTTVKTSEKIAIGGCLEFTMDKSEC